MKHKKRIKCGHKVELGEQTKPNHVVVDDDVVNAS